MVGAQMQACLATLEVAGPGADQVVGGDVGRRLPGQAAEIGGDPIREIAARQFPVLRVDGAVDAIGYPDDRAFVR